MRVSVDATCWANNRGYGRFTRELVKAMAVGAPEHEFICILDRRAAEAFDLVSPNVRTVVVRQTESPTTAAAAAGYRSPHDMLRLGQAVGRVRSDVFFSPTVYTYFPLPPSLPAVVTIHDTIAERFPELTLPSARDRAFWWLKVKLALTQARLILTVSDFSAREISKVHGFGRSRIRVALEAPAAAYRPSDSPDLIAQAAARAGVPAGAAWLTYVGGANPHKRLDVLVRAHRAALRQLRDPIHIVFVGPGDADVFHGHLPALRDLIRQCGSEALTHWPGFLPDEEIRQLHAGAIALMLPSANEGFGLPAVEAAACGTPCIATTASPLPELLAGGGLFVQSGDETALADAIVRLASDADLRRSLGERARERAALLTWPVAARAALAALAEAAA